MGFVQRLRYILKPFIYFPFAYIYAPIFILCVDLSFIITTKLIYGNLEKYNISIDYKPPLIKFLLTANPPLVDIGTIKLIKEGKIKVEKGTIQQFEGDYGVRFNNGNFEEYDAIVYATGYKFVSGHQDFLDKEICDVIGSGLQSLRQFTILPGRESAYPNLWFIWGRLQMIRDIAPGMALSLKKKLGHPIPKISKLMIFCGYHTILTVSCLSLMYFLWK